MSNFSSIDDKAYKNAAANVTEEYYNNSLPSSKMVYLHPAYIPHTIVGIIICLFNGIVVLLVVRERRGCLGEPRHTLMASLAVADFWLGFHVLVSTNILFFLAPFDCKSVVMSLNISAIVSIVMMTILTINQFIAVRYPLRYHQIVTEKRVNIAIGSSWILCIITGAAITKLDTGYVIPNCIIQNVVRPEISLALAITGYFAPAAVLIISNLYIYSQARKHYNLSKYQATVGRAESYDEESMALLNKQRDKWGQVTRTTVTLTIVVFAFILSWMGYWINLLQAYLGGTLGTNSYFGPNTIFESLALLNSLYNPIIYALRFKDFRRALRNLFCCLWCVSNTVGSN